MSSMKPSEKRPGPLTLMSPRYRGHENFLIGDEANEGRGFRYQCRRALIVIIAFILAALL